jgi:hypothetical protein
LLVEGGSPRDTHERHQERAFAPSSVLEDLSVIGTFIDFAHSL